MVRKQQTTPSAVESPAVEEFQLTAQHAAGYCGQALKLARERLGLSVETVAGRLRLSQRQIHALETDDFANLPQSPTVRGFIRNYAKELKIDAAPLIEAYNQMVPDNKPSALTVEPSTNMAITNSDPPKLSGYILAGGLLIGGLLLWWLLQYFISPSKNPVEKTEIAGQPTEIIAPAPELPSPTPESVPAQVGEITSQVPPQIDTQLDATTTQATLPSSEPVSAPVENVTPATPPPPVSSTPAQAAPVAAPISQQPLPVVESTPPAIKPDAPKPAGAVTLDISTTQETWVNIVDANGKELFSKVLTAGSHENFDLKKPLSITVGNASGATLSADGNPIALKTRGDSKVARVKLN